MKVSAPIFGTLALFHVESGARVSVGDRLCEIEAMKTFHPVEARISGTLKWVKILGEAVNEGDLLGFIDVGEKK